MSGASSRGREFEGYALLATFVLIVAALFVREHRVGEPDAAEPAANPDDVLRIVLGGPDGSVAEAPTPAPAIIRDGGLPLPPPTPAILPVDDTTPLEPTPVERTYVVKPGETLSQISARELGTARRASEIARLNGITNANRVFAGQKLKLPPE